MVHVEWWWWWSWSLDGWMDGLWREEMAGRLPPILPRVKCNINSSIDHHNIYQIIPYHALFAFAAHR
jgi:hypothetical protein